MYPPLPLSFHSRGSQHRSSSGSRPKHTREVPPPLSCLKFWLHHVYISLYHLLSERPQTFTNVLSTIKLPNVHRRFCSPMAQLTSPGLYFPGWPRPRPPPFPLPDWCTPLYPLRQLTLSYPTLIPQQRPSTPLPANSSEPPARKARLSNWRPQNKVPRRNRTQIETNPLLLRGLIEEWPCGFWRSLEEKLSSLKRNALWSGLSDGDRKKSVVLVPITVWLPLR